MRQCTKPRWNRRDALSLLSAIAISRSLTISTWNGALATSTGGLGRLNKKKTSKWTGILGIGTVMRVRKRQQSGVQSSLLERNTMQAVWFFSLGFYEVKRVILYLYLTAGNNGYFILMLNPKSDLWSQPPPPLPHGGNDLEGLSKNVVRGIVDSLHAVLHDQSTPHLQVVVTDGRPTLSANCSDWTTSS